MEKGNGKERSKWIAPKVKFKKTNKKKNGDVVFVGDLEQGFVIIIRVFRYTANLSFIVWRVSL